MIETFDSQKLFTGIQNQDRFALARAITLIESESPAHQKEAQTLLKLCLKKPKQSLRLGMSGPPGVGKSTFIEAFGQCLIQKNLKIAVLAIDPSSPKTRGSILGDKTRMTAISNHPQVFVRPTATGGMLGGVAKRTFETMLLCEAFGFDVLVLETVGVGQSETHLRQMVDMFVLLSLAGAGDQLQGIKRGIMEMADMILINKVDSVSPDQKQRAMSDFQAALKFNHHDLASWQIPVMAVSSLKKNGIEEVWQKINEYFTLAEKKGYLEDLRKEQAIKSFQQTLESEIIKQAKNNLDLQKEMNQSLVQIKKGQRSSFDAAFALSQKIEFRFKN